jgi:hypothetical protein
MFVVTGTSLMMFWRQAAVRTETTSFDMALSIMNTGSEQEASEEVSFANDGKPPGLRLK